LSPRSVDDFVDRAPGMTVQKGATVAALGDGKARVLIVVSWASGYVQTVTSRVLKQTCG
jgi:hypothetical protein